MRKDKETAFELRKSGKSYREIRSILKIPLSTLSEWFSAQDWSRDIAQKLSVQRIQGARIRIRQLNRVRGLELAQAYEEARQNARREFQILKEDPLFISGVVAYWGEGDKTSLYNIRLSNTDPGMISLFQKFLREVCLIAPEKITCWLLLYPDLDEATCKAYWTSKAGVPDGNFKKSMYIKGRHPTKRLGYGVCNVVVCSRYLKEKMLEWLRLIAEEHRNAGIV